MHVCAAGGESEREKSSWWNLSLCDRADHTLVYPPLASIETLLTVMRSIYIREYMVVAADSVTSV